MTDTNTVEKFATEPDQSSSNLDMISMPSGLNLEQIDYPENEVYDENDHETLKAKFFFLSWGSQRVESVYSKFPN